VPGTIIYITRITDGVGFIPA